MDHIRSLLPRVLNKRGLFVHAQAAHITLKAQEWLTKEYPELTEALSVTKIQHGTLSITATTSIAVMECQNAIPALKDYLRKEFPSLSLEQIYVSRSS